MDNRQPATFDRKMRVLARVDPAILHTKMPDPQQAIQQLNNLSEYQSLDEIISESSQTSQEDNPKQIFKLS